MIHVGVLKIDFHISESSTLKEKRVVMQRLRDRVRNNFNVSIAEVDKHDKWQAASMGISCVSNDKKYIDGLLNKIKNFFEQNRSIIIMDHQIEIM
ncbi:MAG: DUF503 domain-containing protein [Candidatus Omnitrophica bacterium]|nr:DUF503 domain-containing protein [Candidatus Omnitrophota bacterium]